MRPAHFIHLRLKKQQSWTVDGVGEWATTTICHGKLNQITVLRQLDYPHSLGLLYASFTYYLGFKVNSGEYKLMGLAPYGNPQSEHRHLHSKTKYCGNWWISGKMDPCC
ncbi:MAG: carbamoyltransferase N-terminal domain-containing protein [Puia sp.]